MMRTMVMVTTVPEKMDLRMVAEENEWWRKRIQPPYR